ncbi:GNAT family N-acetyltransferase [Agrobacterium cavarae]|uniref:GNAT family N-acetyltransferase n=1 Tax=Agrobacterium cavarae TaxID=2528239 RepID=A0ABY1YB86_9HYPH|nr:GNAT family N-acetyltransferase [Agrobacterium cavarae]TBN15979.1 GNAT family N-acetyltransferase [Agrobacterium cavarae]
MLTFRKAVPQDEEALYAICLATGDAGKDASHLYADEKLVGNIYAVPYLHLCPDSAFVAEDWEGICGYIVGATDTAAYQERLEQAWWPQLRELYPLAEEEANALPEEHRKRVAFIHQPSPVPASVLQNYPAHIHMNLLERARGTGGGSRLLSMWVEMARSKGIPGIHLGANPENYNGIAFWQSRGFSPLAGMPAGTAWFGMSLDA